MEFITKRRVGRGCENTSDFSFSVNRTGKSNRSQYSVVLSFSPKAEKMCFSGVSYVKIAFVGTRLYFCGANSNDGYKITHCRGRGARGAVKIVIGEMLKKYSCHDWIGSYNVKYDPNENLWYVSRDEKIVGEI